MIDYAALKTLALTLKGTSAEIAAAVNAMTDDVLAPLDSATCLAWSGGNGRAERVYAAANQGVTPDGKPLAPGIRSVAIVAQFMLSRDGTSLDLRLPDRQQMVGALVAGGVLTQADSDALYALAAAKVPKWRTLGFPQPVLPGDVEWALGGKV
jgi:hypothetical protein